MEDREEFEHFSDVRAFFKTYASSRVAKVGVNKSADEMFAEIKSMDAIKKIKDKAVKLATDDYVRKYHVAPILRLVESVFNSECGCRLQMTFKADDMAYYYLSYSLKTNEWEMRTFYRDNEKIWSEEV